MGKKASELTRLKLSLSHIGKRKPLSQIAKIKIGFANRTKPFFKINFRYWNNLRECYFCKKGYLKTRIKANNKFCSRECFWEFVKTSEYRMNQSEKKQGEKSNLWRGGISFEPYHHHFTWWLKEKIRGRDGRRCRMCGVNESELKRSLDVHHIDYNKKNCDKGNLISLCYNCHTYTNHEREYWTQHFMAMLAQEVVIEVRHHHRD